MKLSLPTHWAVGVIELVDPYYCDHVLVLVYPKQIYDMVISYPGTIMMQIVIAPMALVVISSTTKTFVGGLDVPFL